LIAYPLALNAHGINVWALLIPLAMEAAFDLSLIIGVPFMGQGWLFSSGDRPVV